MIPILKTKDEETIGFLADALTCSVTEERNGIYELFLTYPITGQCADELEIDRIILAKPNETSENQLFRIYEVSKPISGIVTVLAEHISYALANYPVTQVSQTKISAQAAIQFLLSNGTEASKFSCISDISTLQNFNVKACSIRSALGGMSGSVLDTYGGEYEFDNYTIYLHQSRGEDNGVSIRYGKNLTDCTMVTNIESVYTHLFPYAISKDSDGNETLITLSERVFELDASKYSTRVLIKDFTDKLGDDVTEDNLRSWVNGYLLFDYEEFEPSINLKVSFQHLWQSPEYASIKALEKVSLCDMVLVYHEQLGVNVKAKVIKTVYDVLGEKYETIEIGNAKSNFADTIKQQDKEIEEIKKENPSYSKITQEYLVAIDNATKKITGNEGGYVVITPTDAPQEILIMNKATIGSATKVWRWNLSGLGYSARGYNGTYKTAITMDGKINADFITTGSLTANVIKAGTITASDSSSYFNLDSGKLATSNAYITGGYISIGSSSYRTVIDDGHIMLYISGFSNPVGGIVPVGTSSKYYTGIYSSSYSSCDGVSLLAQNSDKTFTSIAEFGKSAISLNQSVSVTGGITASGNITFDSYLYDGRGYQVVGMNNNLVFGYGNYTLDLATYIEGGEIYLRCNTDGLVRYQIGSTTRFSAGYFGWMFGSETSYINRDTITSSGGFVLSANAGSNAMYVVASSFRIFTDTYLNFSAASGTVALAVNTKGKITTTGSSERYKENISYKLQKNINPRKLYDLPVCQYNYKNQYQSFELVHGTQIGVLAEDVDTYFPNACIYNKDGQPESWQERILLPAMLKLIQEQKQEIDSLSERLSKLETEENSNEGTD